MSLSDPVADLLTRVRNAHMAEQDVVLIPHSRLKGEVLRVLKREGYIKDLVVEGTERKKVLRVYLKYSRERLPSIQGIKRESRPGLRKYCPVDKLPRVLGGLGIAILSTSAGIMTDREARKARVGGEFICSVW